MSDYTPEQLAGFVERRTREISALEALWKRLSDLRGEKFSLARFDEAINKKFDVGDGRKSLAFESIAETKRMLETAIIKLEKGEK